MEENDDSKSSLVTVTDIFGFGKVTKELAPAAGPGIARLTQAITDGIGKFLEPIHKVRYAKADIEVAKLKAKLSTDLIEGLSPNLQKLANRSLHYNVLEMIGHQDNREQIARHAFDHFAKNSKRSQSKAESFDENFTTQFWRHAKYISDDDLQHFWGQLLSEAAMGNAGVSIRLLSLLSQLDKNDAQLLQHLSKFHMIAPFKDHGNNHYGIITAPPKHAKQKRIADHDARLKLITRRMNEQIGELRQDILDPLGVFRGSQTWSTHIIAPLATDTVPITIGAKSFELHIGSAARSVSRLDPDIISIGSTSQISEVGNQLFQMIAVDPKPAYIDALKDGYELAGMRLTEL